jgi:hypothetical protein
MLRLREGKSKGKGKGGLGMMLPALLSDHDLTNMWSGK